MINRRDSPEWAESMRRGNDPSSCDVYMCEHFECCNYAKECFGRHGNIHDALAELGEKFCDRCILSEVRED